MQDRASSFFQGILLNEEAQRRYIHDGARLASFSRDVAIMENVGPVTTEVGWAQDVILKVWRFF